MMKKYGLRLGGFLWVYGLAFRLLELTAASPLAWVFYLALPVAAVLVLYERRKEGALSYRSGLLLSIGVISIGAAVYAIYVFGFNAFIDDSLIQTARENAFALLAERDLTPEQVASREKFIDLSTTPLGFALYIAIQMIIFGTLTSLLIAAVFRRKLQPAVR
jgi:uncharacterized protein DUF4199